MSYLELEELFIGSLYVCVPYANSEERIILKYIGNGEFEDEEYVYTVEGDIRYVLNVIE